MSGVIQMHHGNSRVQLYRTSPNEGLDTRKYGLSATTDSGDLRGASLHPERRLLPPNTRENVLFPGCMSRTEQQCDRRADSLK